MTHDITAKILSRQGRGYNTQFLLYPRLLACMAERIFVVLYVSIMGLIRCYKSTVFFKHLHCSISTEFTLQMYIIAQTYLRFSKKTNRSHMGIAFPLSIFLCIRSVQNLVTKVTPSTIHVVVHHWRTWNTIRLNDVITTPPMVWQPLAA